MTTDDFLSNFNGFDQLLFSQGEGANNGAFTAVGAARIGSALEAAFGLGLGR